MIIGIVMTMTGMTDTTAMSRTEIAMIKMNAITAMIDAIATSSRSSTIRIDITDIDTVIDNG